MSNCIARFKLNYLDKNLRLFLNIIYRQHIFFSSFPYWWINLKIFILYFFFCLEFFFLLFFSFFMLTSEVKYRLVDEEGCSPLGVNSTCWFFGDPSSEFSCSETSKWRVPSVGATVWLSSAVYGKIKWIEGQSHLMRFIMFNGSFHFLFLFYHWKWENAEVFY